MRTLIASGIVALSLGAGALAEPLNREWVAGDAKWLVHVDVEQFATSRLGQHLISNRDSFDGQKWNNWHIELGIEPLRDVSSFTLYGEQCNQGVGLMVTTVDPEPLFQAMEEKTGRTATLTELDGRTIRHWSDGEEDIYAWITDAGVEGRSLVLFSGGRDRLLHGIRVIDGTEASLAAVENADVDITPRIGSFIVGAVSNLGDVRQLTRRSTVARWTDAFRFDIGETVSDVYAQVTITTSSEEDAENVKTILEGLIAFTVLTSDADVESAVKRSLAQAAKVASDGTSVRLGLSLSVEQALEVLEQKHRENVDETGAEPEALPEPANG